MPRRDSGDGIHPEGVTSFCHPSGGRLRKWHSSPYGWERASMACPRRVGVPQGRAGGSWHVLVARETRTASGWKQSKEERPAFTVAGQHARVWNQALCEAPGATTESRFLCPFISCRSGSLYQFKIIIYVFASGHTAMNAPDPIRTRKLSIARPG